MEIKLNLRLQTLLSLVHLVENMERETLLLLAMGLLMTPFVFGSLWSITLTLIWQLFWLGVKGGLLLFVVCAVYFGLVKTASVTYPKFANGGCSLGDIFLSMIFHCGLRIPTPVWDTLTQYFGLGSVEAVETLAKTPRSRVTFAVPESTTKVYEVSPPSPTAERPDEGVCRRITRSSPKEIFTLPSCQPAPSEQPQPVATPSGSGRVGRRRNATRKQVPASQPRSKRLVFDSGNGNESDSTVTSSLAAFAQTVQLN